MDRPEWISRARPVEAVRVDIGFLIAETFYHGPENGFTQEQWQQLREPLYQPEVERSCEMVLSVAVGESGAELLPYYQDVLRLIVHHRKEIARQSQYFWIRPLIFVRGVFAMTFPWYDTWDEAVLLLDALAAARDGWVFSDIEQGWDFQAFAEGGRLFLREGDPDAGEEHVVIATNQEQFVAQIPAVLERVGRLLEALTGALGRNYWSRIM